MIEISNANYIINENKILNNISLSILEGEIVSIIGPGGSSKTTLLKMISNSIPNININYTLNRSPIKSLSKKEIKEQFEFMHSELPENKEEKLINFLLLSRTVNKSLFQPISDYDIQIVEEYINCFKLEDKKNKRIRNLSSTELKKMLILYSMIKEKKYLLLDNPFSALDLKSINSLYLQMKRYVNNGIKNIIFTTYDVNHAINISDRILLMKKGQIIKNCSPNEIDEDDIKFIFDVDVIKYKNIYNGKSEFHLFPEA